VPWGKLHTAHGTAERVPAAIRGLAGADADTADDWYWQLDNNVVLQGSVYEAGYYVIPFMLAMVDSALPSEVRARAYDLLVEIARGVPGDSTRATVGDGSEEVPLVQAARRLIEGKFARYRADLLGSDPVPRRKALDLLVSLDLPSDELRALLESVEPGEDREFGEVLRQEISDLEK
jgi:hypothetical protein